MAVGNKKFNKILIKSRNLYKKGVLPLIKAKIPDIIEEEGGPEGEPVGQGVIRDQENHDGLGVGLLVDSHRRHNVLAGELQSQAPQILLVPLVIPRYKSHVAPRDLPTVLRI